LIPRVRGAFSKERPVAHSAAHVPGWLRNEEAKEMGMVMIPSFSVCPERCLSLADDQGNVDATAALAPGDGEVEVRHLQDLGELFRGTSRCSVQDR
jgi:hypothetical protein